MWFIFFLMAGIGTYFFYEQVFEGKAVVEVPAGSNVSSPDETKEEGNDGLEEEGKEEEKPGTAQEDDEKVEDQEETLSDAEVQEVVTGLFEGILGTFRELGAEYNWSNRSNPADFDILKPKLLEYASESFINGHLRELSGMYYCECDAPLTPYPMLDLRFTVIENSPDKIVASSIQFSNELHSDNGGTIYFTVVQENERWVMDGWTHVRPEKEDMMVTWEEYEAYLQEYNEVTFLSEVMHQGEKVYVFFNHTFMGLSAIYAASTNAVYDIPIEWIPEEYRKPPYYIKILEGTWKHEIYSGGLEIRNAYMNYFDFRLNVVSNGGHVGELEGMVFIDGTKAFFNESDYGCQITFELSNDTIKVTENAGCNAWHGMNVSFEGVYRKEE